MKTFIQKNTDWTLNSLTQMANQSMMNQQIVSQLMHTIQQQNASMQMMMTNMMSNFRAFNASVHANLVASQQDIWGVLEAMVSTSPHFIYTDVIMSVMASEITSLTIVYSTVYSGADQRIHQSLRVTGLCEWNSPVTGKFTAQMASKAENVSIWWRHHGSLMSSQITGSVLRMFIQQLCPGWQKGDIEAPHYWPIVANPSVTTNSQCIPKSQMQRNSH